MINIKTNSLLKQFTKPLDLRHLIVMSTNLGLIQHAYWGAPDLRFGYSIDDNARAAVALLKYDELFKTETFKELGVNYVNYLFRARKPNGSYHNFADKRGKFIDEVGSLDSQGRMLWALGFIAGSPVTDERIKQKAFESVGNYHFFQTPFLRSRAFAVLGYIYSGYDRKALFHAKKILKLYKTNKTDGWHWFEDFITYSNAIIPLAMLKAGTKFKNEEMIETARESFLWLNKICHEKGYPAPIGSFGWYRKNEKKAIFDQQVVDAADMVLFASSYYQYTHEKKYLEIALEWMNWFYGNNVQNKSMISQNGGIYDGITEEGVNENQGAESLVMYLLAYLAIAKIALEQDK